MMGASVTRACQKNMAPRPGITMSDGSVLNNKVRHFSPTKLKMGQNALLGAETNLKLCCTHVLSGLAEE